MDNLFSMGISFLFYAAAGIAFYVVGYSSLCNRWVHEGLLLCIPGIVLWDLYLYGLGYPIRTAPLYADSLLFGLGVCTGALGCDLYLYLKTHKPCEIISTAVLTAITMVSLLAWSWFIAGSDPFHFSFPVFALVFSFWLGKSAAVSSKEGQ